MYITRRRALNIPILFSNKDRTVASKALVDSRATENFMDKQAVKRLGVGRICLAQSKRVHNINDTQNQAGEITHCLLHPQNQARKRKKRPKSSTSQTWEKIKSSWDTPGYTITTQESTEQKEQ
jgi:hypothetical protein